MKVVYTKRGYPFSTGHRRYHFISRSSRSVRDVQGSSMPLESYTARWFPIVGFSALRNSGCASKRQPRNVTPIQRRTRPPSNHPPMKITRVSEMQPQTELHAALVHRSQKHLADSCVTHRRVRGGKVRVIERVENVNAEQEVEAVGTVQSLRKRIIQLSLAVAVYRGD